MTINEKSLKNGVHGYLYIYMFIKKNNKIDIKRINRRCKSTSILPGTHVQSVPQEIRILPSVDTVNPRTAPL